MPPAKAQESQRVNPREPRQERSRQKVELMLEAAIRILEKEGLEGLTTNAIAARAGVSIGTLYQYFPNKEAILDDLADRELRGMSGRVMAAMQNPLLETTQDRVAALVRAVADTYGQRHDAHRLVMAHSLSRGGNRMAPLLTRLRSYLSGERSIGAIRATLDPADAFVLSHAFTGALRAMITDNDDAPAQADIERSLTRLVVRFMS